MHSNSSTHLHKTRWQRAIGLLIAGSGSALLAHDMGLWMRHSVY